MRGGQGTCKREVERKEGRAGYYGRDIGEDVAGGGRRKEKRRDEKKIKIK